MVMKLIAMIYNWNIVESGVKHHNHSYIFYYRWWMSNRKRVTSSHTWTRF